MMATHVAKTLITGVNGFVGRMLSEQMIACGWSVRGTVRALTQLNALPVGVEGICIGSITPHTDWSAALTGIDTVVHLAARVHVLKESAADPMEAFRTVNVAGTERLARMAAAAGVRRLVFLSSVKVNGEGRTASYTEQDEVSPQDPYSISKWEAEQILRLVAAETGLEVIILRPPLVYGPRVKANFLNLMKLVHRGIPIPLLNVGNLSDVIITCITNPKASGQTFLVSDDESVSTPELVRRLATALGRSARLVPFPLFLMHFAGKVIGKSSAVDRLLSSLSVDISKIRKDLGWSPPATMAQGLKETADWFKTVSVGKSKPMKRTTDIVIAVFALVFLFVPLSVIAAFVKMTSQGPILYWSDRIGKNNSIFKMPKFRTMKVNTPAVATHLLSEPEQYLTSIGKFLRKYSLDELPQLFSVIKGDMSFVGPRPALFNQDDLIVLRTQKKIHLLTPGLTGWAQVNGRDELSIPIKVGFDEYYLYHRSFLFDVEILCMTFFKAMRGEGVQH
jgi:lipopolysaccharide/colanic/teichoic acid biosynthesis glycosyltransferase/uncharacterized protein YbjT (DUF2867 family)